MLSRAAAVSLWIVPLAVVVVLLWRIDRRVGWDAAFTPAAAPEDDGREQRAPSVFGVDSSANGEFWIGVRRGNLGQGAPLLIFSADGQTRRIPAAETIIGRTVFWSAALFPDGASLLVAAGPA